MKQTESKQAFLIEPQDTNKLDPARDAADAFLDFTCGLTLDQVKRAIDLIAVDLAQSRADARDIAAEMRDIRKLCELED